MARLFLKKLGRGKVGAIGKGQPPFRKAEKGRPKAALAEAKKKSVKVAKKAGVGETVSQTPRYT